MSQIVDWNLLEKLKRINSHYCEFLKDVMDNKLFFIKIGKIEKSNSEKTYDLKKNGSIYFDASLPHSLKNIGSKTAKLIVVVSPVAL